MGHLSRSNAVILCVGVLAVSLSGCGRKGALEPPPGLPQAAAPGSGPNGQSLAGTATNLSEGGFQDANGDPSLIQSPNYVYERSAIAKLNAATAAPPARPINAPPAPQPSTFFLDPLVK